MLITDLKPRGVEFITIHFTKKYHITFKFDHEIYSCYIINQMIPKSFLKKINAKTMGINPYYKFAIMYRPEFAYNGKNIFLRGSVKGAHHIDLLNRYKFSNGVCSEYGKSIYSDLYNFIKSVKLKIHHNVM